MMKIFKLFLFVWVGSKLFAQQLHLSGIVVFERKENMHKQLNGTSAWQDELKDKMPKYRTDEFTLSFNAQQSLYKLTKEESNAFANWWRVAASNTVYKDLQQQKAISIKDIYDEKYVIEDSIPAYRWRYYGDYRKIAGYNCRKAATIINDSLYVIAFYTDQIPVSTGPESFGGLPGLILGIVVPKLNITCFATQIQPKSLQPEAFNFKKPKSKTISMQQFITSVLDATKKWGEYASKVYFKSLL
jgi:GLPGLI family protein